MNNKTLRAYSLIEVLVVIAIFSIIALVLSQILSTTLRGAAKTEISSKLKQEGNYILSIMERKIRNASEITVCDGTKISFKDANSPTGSFSCVEGVEGMIKSGDTTMTGNTTKVIECNFSCTPPNPPYRSVDLFMILEKGVQSGTMRTEETARVELKTRIMLRN